MRKRTRSLTAPIVPAVVGPKEPASLGLAFAFAWLLVAGAARADLDSSLDEIDYAFVGGRGGLVLHGSDAVWLLDPDGGYEQVFCAPPHEGTGGILSPSGSLVVEYLAGTGFALATGALATSEATQLNSIYVDATPVFEFRVIPNDPEATNPVEIEVVARHTFAQVRAEVSGAGGTANSQQGVCEIRQLFPIGPRVGSAWLSQGVVPSEGAVMNSPRPIEVPISSTLYLFANVKQESDARGAGVGFEQPFSRRRPDTRFSFTSVRAGMHVHVM